MSRTAAQNFYTNPAWDEKSWLEVIGIEYELLANAFPFRQHFEGFGSRPIRLLDVGCGTGLFPRFLDPLLGPNTLLTADLLDISKHSLQEAGRVLTRLAHFQVGRKFHDLIENIPTTFAEQSNTYDLAWSIHSFTTVDVAQMPAVYAHLVRMLTAQGLLLVFQLVADSAYQELHGFFRQNHPDGRGVRPYMEFEQSTAILASLGVPFKVIPLQFVHTIPADRPRLLEKYLSKVTLQEHLEAVDFFQPLLSTYYNPQEDAFIFPQRVHLLVAQK